jgi:HD superfamily phosphodiesterase
MNITDQIITAEVRYKKLLEQFFINAYDEHLLPSHGLDHHRRVWGYSKQLIKILADNNLLKVSEFPLKLLFASYLHDIGMTIDQGPRHGNHSKDLCYRFLLENNLDPLKFIDVTDAIENHDNKEYQKKAANHDLLEILSVADDLDAFGFIGIYRYAEVYLKRKIKPQDIGSMIRKNGAQRFENFSQVFGFSSDFEERVRDRFNILDRFFIEYNNQVPHYTFGISNPSGYCGVIDIFISAQDPGEKDTFSNFLHKYSKDPVIHWFFKGITDELDSIS